MKQNSDGNTRSGFSGPLAILGLVLLAIGISVYFGLSEIRLAAWLSMGLGLVALVTAVVLSFKYVFGSVIGRRGLMNISTTISSLIFVVIIIVVNAISFGNYHRFDTTTLGQFTLSDQTKNLLETLKYPVSVLSFYEPGDPIGSYADNLLKEYESRTSKLSHKNIDPIIHPDQAEQYGITTFPTFVFESQGRRKLVLPQEVVVVTDQNYAFEVEHPFSSALLEVTGVAQRKVYFLTGHGEHDINSDYHYAREGLLNDLYLVGSLNLMTSPSIPADCAALIIAGPNTAISAPEVDIIKGYLAGGGQAMVLADPNFPSSFYPIVLAFGIEVTNGVVIDPTSNLNNRKDTPVVAQANNAFALPNTYFPGTTALFPLQQVADNLGGRQLLTSSADSWLETKFDPSSDPVFNSGTDIKGPLILGMLVAASPSKNTPTQSKTTRMVIIGDSDFASNTNIMNANNGDLFLNSVAWLAEETPLVNIRRNVLPFRQLVVNPAQTNFITYSSIFLMPVVVILIGVIIWWRRR
jgi:ABC-type uncharacterized transport system involved in gliding motility auxiliary subunit